MTAKAALLLMVILIALALGPGCIAPQGGGGTPTPTLIPAVTVTPEGSPARPPGDTRLDLPPGPVVTAPPYQDVIVQVMKNPSTANPYISVAFRGGAGSTSSRRSRSRCPGQTAR